MTCIVVKFENTASKRKLDVDNNGEAESNSTTTEVNEEPDAKRIKTGNQVLENDNEVSETDIKV